jgi:hypothetical protein
MIRRVALVLSAAAAAMAIPLMSPAWACGCGAYSPNTAAARP